MNFSFGKEYKLCSKKVIDHIFEQGKTVKQFPVLTKFFATELKTEKSFQIVFAVPKRSFKKAVDRNRIKRLLREATRLEKNVLESYLKKNNRQIALFIIFTAKEEIKLSVLQTKINKSFNKIIEQLENEKSHH